MAVWIYILFLFYMNHVNKVKPVSYIDVQYNVIFSLILLMYSRRCNSSNKYKVTLKQSFVLFGVYIFSVFLLNATKVYIDVAEFLSFFPKATIQNTYHAWQNQYNIVIKLQLK